MEKWQEEDCARVAALFEGVNRAAFARENSVPGGQAMIYQHIRSLRPIGLDAAVAYAKGFKVDLSRISPTLSGKVRDVLLPDGAVPSVPERNTKWPFRDISEEQWLAISSDDRARVEGYARAFLHQNPGQKRKETAA